MMKKMGLGFVLALSLLVATSAEAKVLLVRQFDNRAKVTDLEAKRIYDVFMGRLQTIRGWNIIDSAKIQTANPPAVCDQDCQVALAQKLNADLVMLGSIEPSTQPGLVDVRVTLFDPASWKEVQSESHSVGPDIEKDLGRVSSLARLFDPNSVSAEATQGQQDHPDNVSRTANWIIGGVALAVLVAVLVSIL